MRDWIWIRVYMCPPPGGPIVVVFTVYIAVDVVYRATSRYPKSYSVICLIAMLDNFGSKCEYWMW